MRNHGSTLQRVERLCEEAAFRWVAEINMDEIARGTFDLDVTGHYNGPDVFGLGVRRRRE
jgi:hypothetical protein